MREDSLREERIRYELDGISPRRQALDRFIVHGLDRLIYFVLRHWLGLLNYTNALTFLGAFAVPYLMSVGADWLAQPLFVSYSLICPQRPSHSFYLFGYQMAMEQRMVAIYGAMTVAGLLFVLARHSLRPLDWRLFLLLSLPMLVDVFSQTFALRESDGFWRTLTGSLFGVVVAWWAYPYIERALGIVLARAAREVRPG